MSDPEVLNLAMLNGATLKWEDSDGNIHSVQFDDNCAVDTGTSQSTGGDRP